MKTKKPRAGECLVCKCTHTTPCAEGCAWTDNTDTLCTACQDVIDTVRMVRDEHGWATVQRLFAELERQVARDQRKKRGKR